ncbi:MAG: hypothetical protein AAEI08_01495, partial [Gammaproteobacteria bacterium]
SITLIFAPVMWSSVAIGWLDDLQTQHQTASSGIRSEHASNFLKPAESGRDHRKPVWFQTPDSARAPQVLCHENCIRTRNSSRKQQNMAIETETSRDLPDSLFQFTET